MNFAELAAKLGLEEEEYTELVELLLATAPNDLQNLSMALENDDVGAVAGAAHSLKGAAANLGFAELADIAGEIEAQARMGLLAGLNARVAALQQGFDEIASALG